MALRAYPFFIEGRQDVIFIHITKTAGTSIRKAFNFNRPNRKEGLRKHYHAREAINLLGTHVWNQAFTFTFVRNPWDRFFSFYRYKKSKQQTMTSPNDPIKIDDFRTWAFGTFKTNYDQLKPQQLKNFAPQADWVQYEDGTSAIDYVGRYEELQSSFEYLCKRVNIDATLPHLIKSEPRLNYRDYYEKDLIDLVAEIYGIDITTFNYDFK